MWRTWLGMGKVEAQQRSSRATPLLLLQELDYTGVLSRFSGLLRLGKTPRIFNIRAKQVPWGKRE